ncbi:MAG: hypothetical protein R3F34_10300 [Planctomycetota bacterium]
MDLDSAQLRSELVEADSVDIDAVAVHVDDSAVVRARGRRREILDQLPVLVGLALEEHDVSARSVGDHEHASVGVESRRLRRDSEQRASVDGSMDDPIAVTVASKLLKLLLIDREREDRSAVDSRTGRCDVREVERSVERPLTARRTRQHDAVDEHEVTLDVDARPEERVRDFHGTRDDRRDAPRPVRGRALEDADDSRLRRSRREHRRIAHVEEPAVVVDGLTEFRRAGE